jgi:hypothetical protein
MNHPRSAEPSAARAVLRVYQRDDHHWGWCYQEPDSGNELHSNDDYPTREEAAASARRAYPDVPLVPDASRLSNG